MRKIEHQWAILNSTAVKFVVYVLPLYDKKLFISSRNLAINQMRAWYLALFTCC